MSATVYQTTSTYLEDGYGLVTEVIVVSDTYDGLFEDGIEVGILRQKTVKKEVNLQSSSYVEDSFEITIDESTVESPDDADCLSFVLSAQDKTKTRFIAYFIQPASPRTIDELSFSGIISPSMKAKEVVWENFEEYDPDTQPLYVWDISSKSFDLSSFDGDILYDLLENETDGLWTDTTWKNTYIQDRLGYCDLGSGKVAKFCNLVNMNEYLKAIANILSNRMTTRLQTTTPFQIIFDECTLDLKLCPTRWFNRSYYNKDTFFVTRFVGDVLIDSPIPNQTFIEHYYKMDLSEAQTVKLGSSISDDDSPFISSLLFFPEHQNATVDGQICYDGTPHSGTTLSFVQDKNTTFANHIIGLAASLGLMIRFYYASPTELHIKFIARTGFEQWESFIPDVNEAQITTNPFSSSSEKSFYGVACQYADEGINQMFDYLQLDGNSTHGGFNQEQAGRVAQTGNRLLVTISPTIRHQTMGDAEDTRDLQFNYIPDAIMPYNAAIYHPAGVRRLDPARPSAIWNSIGLHTGLYLKTTGKETSETTNIGGLNVTVYNGKGLNGREIYTPAGWGVYNYGGIAYPIAKLADYVNLINGLSTQGYQTEKDITIPYLCRFRKTQNGSHADDDGGRGRWQNIQLGCKISFGAGGTLQQYLVTSIEQDSEKKVTRLKLWHSSLFAFSFEAGLSNTIKPDANGKFDPIYDATKNNLASGDIAKFDVVILNADRTVSKALPFNDHVGKYYGIALNDAADGDSVTILQPGRTFYNSDWDFDPRTPLFLRLPVTSGYNISSNLLQAKSSVEDVVLLLGYGDGSKVDTIDFTDINNQLILTR